MRILISSLQVSQSGSKGHLHPAIEIALEAKRQGHSVAVLPIPSQLGRDDRLQFQKAGIEYIEPPTVPKGIIKSPGELAFLAADKELVHFAYSSFLLDPISYQCAGIKNILKKFKPDIVLYDLLVYSTPLMARSLGIPDFGYCGGLKLLAPEHLLGTYADVAKKLSDKRDGILENFRQNLRYHHLELLSDYGQAVFASPSFMVNADYKPGVHLVGPLPSSKDRGDSSEMFSVPEDRFAVLSFGSVLDPYDFPDITSAIFKATDALGLKLIMGSRKFSKRLGLPKHVHAFPYLPIPALIQSAEAYIHHGGANSLSEALRLGAKQILIPLTTDQPIQAHYLRQSNAGIAIAPPVVTHDSLQKAIQDLNDFKNPLHANISRMKHEYASVSGSTNFLSLISDFQKRRQT